MSSREIFDIPGGIHPDERKTLSNRTPIQFPPLPKRLIVPLNQHIGTPAEPCISVGQRVLKGQLIAEAAGALSVTLHAPTSGTVSFIGAQPYPHISGMLAAAIVIDSDGLDEWTALETCDHFHQLSATELLDKIRRAGVNGLGGAGFPTDVKLTARPQQKIHTLIINGSECEPYITSDDLLMREKASEMLSGIDILVQLIKPNSVLIGIEDNKPEAIAAVCQRLDQRPYQVVVFPSKYPSGGEKQLIQILTGREVPSGGLPADIGVLCQNVGTCVAIHDAVVLGRPLISRITTLTGEALSRPMNVEGLIGTPVGELLAFAGLDQTKLNRLIMGGPMMGFSLPSLEVPLIKTSNCLLASTAVELATPAPAQPCIRCGDCASACPVNLLPQQLYFFALGKQTEQLKAHQLFDCIECGACAYVCPSSIPLVQYYRAAKATIREQEQQQQKAEHARLRFEFRQERLRRADEQKEAERLARAERAAKAKANQPAASSAAADDLLKRLKIEASMAQVAVKKAEKQLALHDSEALKTQVAALRNTAQAAQEMLQQAQASAPAAAPAATGATDEPLKQAKINLALKRAELKKAETAELTEAERQLLREALNKAEAALHTAENARPKAAPQHILTDKSGLSEQQKALKTEVAFARAELRKLERSENPAAQVLDSARARLAEAEHKLAEHQEPPTC